MQYVRQRRSMSWLFVYELAHAVRLRAPAVVACRQELRLVTDSPHLHFRLKNGKNGKVHTLLLSSDYERTNWRDSIVSLKCKGKLTGAPASSASSVKVRAQQPSSCLCGACASPACRVHVCFQAVSFRHTVHVKVQSCTMILKGMYVFSLYSNLANTVSGDLVAVRGL